MRKTSIYVCTQNTSCAYYYARNKLLKLRESVDDKSLISKRLLTSQLFGLNALQALQQFVLD